MRRLRRGNRGAALVVMLAVVGPADRSADSAPRFQDETSPPATSPSVADGFDDAGEDTTPADRIVRRFDFEEAETARLEFPDGFNRNVAEDRGFPRFGQVRLTNECAAGGNWSFHFGLDGGSLSAGIPSGVLPVLPLADYTVTTRVRTLGLVHARARLIAWFQDAAGQPIPGSRKESSLAQTGGSWGQLSVNLTGDYPDAVDLLLELQVVQPKQYDPDSLAADRPVLEDVAGDAWFDDVTIWHLPRIELSTTSANNIVVRPDEPELRVLIRDLSINPLSARLRVCDIDGKEVFTRSFPSPRGRLPITFAPSLPKFGWYQAELTIGNGPSPVARRRLAFVVLPPTLHRAAARENGFSVVLPYEEAAGLSNLPELVRRLEVGNAVVPIWDERMIMEGESPRFPAMRHMIDSLLATDTQLTFALDSVPAQLAREAGVDPSQVLELLNRDPAIWRTSLDEMLINFGLRVRNWQVGNVGEADAFWKDDLQSLVNGVTSTLSNFLPEPTLLVPFVADQEIPSTLALPGISIIVPHEVLPESLPDYAAPWLQPGRTVNVQFEPLPSEVYTPRQQVVDLLLRGLYGWRAQLPVMAIDAPWHVRRAPESDIAPTPIFAAWRGLIDAIGGRTFAGLMPIGDGIHCWLLQGSGSDDNALVIWRDQRAGDDPYTCRLILADHAVRTVDPFGNTRDVPQIEFEHHIDIDDTPIFVEDIDLELARFRAGFALEPALVPARHRVHDRELVLTNPWNVGISGSIRLRDPHGCHFTPRQSEFVIPANGELRIPLTVVCDRSIVAGRKRLEADVDLTADREYRLGLQADFLIGWESIEMSASWSVARNAETGTRDLVVTQIVTNRGDTNLNLDAFVIGPGTGQNRRIIAALQPGSTVTKSFHIPNGAAMLSNQRVRYGVSERGGVAQLNHVLTLPDLSNFEPPTRHVGVPD